MATVTQLAVVGGAAFLPSGCARSGSGFGQCGGVHTRHVLAPLTCWITVSSRS